MGARGMWYLQFGTAPTPSHTSQSAAPLRIAWADGRSDKRGPISTQKWNNLIRWGSTICSPHHIPVVVYILRGKEN